ncbi:unnamed protein product, partial [Vitis vinifera]|uniref:Uncharacterized protein n=1 Tax=Vitis vinifera TaxID=29760 RepID=D7U1L9_VITVI
MNVGALTNEKNVEGRQTPLHLLAHSQLRFPSFIRNKKVDKMTLNNQNLTIIDVISSVDDLFGGKGLFCPKTPKLESGICCGRRL